MRILTDKEGYWVSKSFPSSTMAIRWPMAGDGYRTMASSMTFERERDEAVVS